MNHLIFQPPFIINSSGFFLFCSEHRPQIKAQYPSLGIGDVAKKLGEQWNSLTDSTKQPYLIKANKLKDKYQKACRDLDASLVFQHVTCKEFDNITCLFFLQDVADYKTKGKVGSVSVPMPMGMMANCMAPKPVMKSNMDDEDDDEEEEDEEEDDDEYDDDE